MHASIQEIIESRISANNYDSSRKLSHDEISELVRLATLAPSAYNFQNWKFLAVVSDEAKQRLQAAAFNQQKVSDAAVTFIICGTLNAHTQLEPALRPSVDAGIIDNKMLTTWVSMAEQSHTNNAVLQRDEALRSASLAAMTLMLAAQGKGLASCALSGFDADAVTREFDLHATEIPVMLITVGYAATGNWPQKPRKQVHEVMQLV
ncbi:nitroreductase [Undibacterium sp. YM2]|uniref:nitroreductase family protein n=1 Tax=Undibacterium sp. YM2 TaxID=2058625 RepID=UPI001331EFDE|nr:nitroreductase family protein [Undibacterium sp. YM2]BBB68818.1 nitroreductase [Undibacterium sp. YM2]